tara:strand:+ start:8417 stop:9022 length:606 start_codon:yes stop_codon:yes gene_type:complete
MATTATPHGFRPVGLLGGGTWSDAIRHIKIASNYGTAIFYGDVVKLVSSGTVEKDTGTTAMTPCGIFVGVRYTDPSTSQLTFAQHYPANTVASDIMAYVCDDPNVVFQAQADEAIAQTGLGNNVAVVQTAGSTAIGTSKNAIDGGSIAVTKTLPVRIIDFVDGPNSSVGDAFTDVICKFNSGGDATGDSCASHQYQDTTGI